MGNLPSASPFCVRFSEERFSLTDEQINEWLKNHTLIEWGFWHLTNCFPPNRGCGLRLCASRKAGTPVFEYPWKG